jgi:molybdopterin-containing oxidoreductase family iron-sulfur binding subunit
MALSGFALATSADIVKADMLKTNGTAEKTPKRYGMIVSVFGCAKKEGCTACIDACRRVHNVPDIPDRRREIKWIWTSPFEALFPEQPVYAQQLRGRRTLALCNHCEDPPCVAVCPTKATFKRDDGIVVMDYHRCIGCRYCMAACPYGARSFNWCDPRPFIHTIDKGYPTRTKGVVEKCDFCEERLLRGLQPACVDACADNCLAFGDLNDEDSNVRKLLASRPALRRKPELGTRPKVFYLLA